MPAEPTSERLAATIAARRYFLHDESKQDIAKAMGISRFKAARLIDQAKAQGLVRISIDWPGEVDLERSAKASEMLGVTVRVAASVPDQPSDLLVGQVCADVVRPLLHTNDTIGVSWGRGVSTFVTAAQDLPRVDVVQLIGGLDAAAGDLSGDALVRRLAQATGGQPFVIQAPIAVQSTSVADALKREPNVRETFQKFDDLDVAVVGIGSWPLGTLTTLMSPDERAEVTHGVADVCGRVLDRHGQVLATTFYERLIAIQLPQLQAATHVIGLATGADKSCAIKAACASGFLQTLVTDAPTADAILGQMHI
jgi:DNA-binding transcriptional regulator LsrR (DeoR family)